jgi:mono/diheme cytochrome c family protein
MRRHVLLLLLASCFCSMVYSCRNADQITQDMYYTNGRDLYLKRCQNCHGEQGEGLADLIPSLTDTLYLKNNKSRLACFLKNGMSEKIVVDGRTFEEKMPANPDLNDIDLAQLLVYITNANGNKQGMYTTEQVAEDLKDCK